VAKNDELGHKLQDAKLLVRVPRGRSNKGRLQDTEVTQ
jgi:hypothetical protein